MKLSGIRMSKRLSKAIRKHPTTADVNHVLEAMSVLTEVLEHLELNDHAYSKTYTFYARRLKVLDKVCVKLLNAPHPYESLYD